VRPVNLLPQADRPYVGSGGKGKSSYVVIGVLAVLVAGVAGYVLTSNQISSKKDEIAQARADQQQAEARVASLESYGTFSAIAQTRIATVASLAVSRIDYERVLRETARVLPSDVWLSQLDAESGSGANGSPATASTTSTASSSSTPSGTPTVHLVGCAKSQDDVATALVRLRAIHGSDDVQLNDSSKDITSSATSGGSAAAGSTGCGADYAFDILVQLSPNTITGAGDLGTKVPTSLGGGS
jgi:Tfp pilus assembly protein PilN